jgi:LysR family glycine cleavage system transcriptional activator
MKRRLPSLNALRTFEAVGRLGRMISAAEELSVTPGAVSRQIRQLEEYLGLELIEGTKKNPSLSQEGRKLLPRLTSALDEIETAILSIMRPEQDILDVSCLSSLMMRWLIPRLYRFNSLHPQIDVRLSTLGGAIPLGFDRFDVLITVGNSAEPERLVGSDGMVIDLFPEELGPVLSPDLASELNITSPKNLPGKALLRTHTRPDAWDSWKKLAGVERLEATGPEFEHYYFTLEAASAGLGLCLSPRHLVVSDILNKRLLAPFGFITSGNRYFAASRKRTDKAACFCAWLLQEAQTLGGEKH